MPFSQQQNQLNNLLILRCCTLLDAALCYHVEFSLLHYITFPEQTQSQWCFVKISNTSIDSKHVKVVSHRKMCISCTCISFSDVLFFWGTFSLKNSSSHMIRWSHWVYYMTPPQNNVLANTYGRLDSINVSEWEKFINSGCIGRNRSSILT